VSGYVCPNILMKVLQQTYQTPLYINAKVFIQPNWQALIELVSVSEANE
jgi:hypothetical protein